MAFIRKHRLVMVPAFLVMLGAAGLILVLHSQSAEPRRADSALSVRYPRETVKAWQEDVSKRAQHAREYRFIRTVEYVDPETEEVVTEQSVSTVRERATNACYKDEAGKWQPTVAEWERGGPGFRMKANSWQIEVPQTLGSAYEYTVDGRTLAMQPTQLVVSDGVRSAFLGRIDQNVAGRIDQDDASKLVFTDVLGAGSGVDIELVLEPASLHQNIVLRARPELPEGFDAEKTRLFVYTELGLDPMTASGDVTVRVGDKPSVLPATAEVATERNTTDPITFSVAKTVRGQRQEKVLHRFVESRVWDETGPANETVAARQLWRHPVTSETYLVESLPYSYVTEATGAVTLDYESQNGTIDEDQIWTADATYYVTGDVVVGAGKTLTIEPGTVVKFAEGTQINVGICQTEANAKVIAKGEPCNYIVFTTDTDDNCGEDLTPGESTSGSGMYFRVAIEVGYYGDADSEIEYCKAAYGEWGFVTSRRINTPVAHCIARDCWCGILVCRGDSTSASDVHNCLVSSSYLGICAWMRVETSPEITIQNCTLTDACAYGIRIHLEDNDPTPSVEAKNNLITGCLHYGIALTGAGENITWDLDYNAFWDNDADFSGIEAGDQGTNNVFLNSSPYDTSNTQLGDFFVDKDGGGLSLMDVGSANFSSIYGSGAQFDVGAAEAIDEDITTDTTWAKRAVDTGTVDIGYHHPRVDYVIDDTAVAIGWTTSTVTLTVNPGVVVAFNGSSSSLRFNASATADPTLACDGAPDDYIVLAGGPRVSMLISTKRDGYSTGALLRNPVSADEEVSITYCRFIGLKTALQVYENSTDEIMHCTFEQNDVGAYLVYFGSPTTVTLKNSLFENNGYGCHVYYGYGPVKSISIRNCTFDRCETGIRFEALYYYYVNNAVLTVSDCLFSDCSAAGMDAYYLPTTSGHWNEDHNAYWHCDFNILIKSPGDNPGAYPIGDNSIVLLADPYDPDWFDAEDPASADWGAQWYLDQNGACIDGGSDVVQDSDIDLDTFTTDLDGALDIATVDIGYHYPGPAGVEDVDLEDDSTGTDLVDVVVTDTQDIELNIDVDNSGDDDWTLYVNETPLDTGTGDFSDYTLDLSEVTDGDGTYVIKIVYDDPDIDDIIFTIIIDETSPGVTIQWPEDTATIGGI